MISRVRTTVESYGGPVGFVLTWTVGLLFIPFQAAAWLIDTIREWWYQ